MKLATGLPETKPNIKATGPQKRAYIDIVWFSPKGKCYPIREHRDDNLTNVRVASNDQDSLDMLVNGGDSSTTPCFSLEENPLGL
jgi:hypothetical protein